MSKKFSKHHFQLSTRNILCIIFFLDNSFNLKSRLKSRSLSSANSKEVVETLKKRKTLASNIIEARQNVDILDVEDVETGNDLQISKGPDVSPEAERRNLKPQACHFDIAESLPVGLFNLTKPLDHWTIHEVLIQVSDIKNIYT